MKKEFSVTSVVRELQQKSITFNVDGQRATSEILEYLITNKFTFTCIVVVPDDCILGNKSLGKLDFLSRQAKDGLGNTGCFIIEHKQPKTKDHKLVKFNNKINKEK